MNRSPHLLLGALFLSVLPVTAARSEEPAARRETALIFDTDIGNDVDDVLALGMIHALQSRGECKLLAVTITKDHPLAAAFTDAVNTFYKRGDIPIGVCRSGVTPEQGKFNGLAEAKDGDKDRFPHDLRSGDQAPDAVAVLRSALASAEDQSVVIAQVGFSTNLAALLESAPDDTSPLDGTELVKQKVRLLSIMAGAFAPIPRDNGQVGEHREYNVIKDIPAAKRIADTWPTEILWSGYEIGIGLPYPVTSIDHDYRYRAPHPLPEAYRLYCAPGHNRPTWDLTSVLIGIRPEHGYFALSPAGTVTVKDDGLTVFKPEDGGRHRYLITPPNGADRVLEALTLLSSQPPQ
ncbi:MAG: nucleoside hydrolase [Planctomycetaceae bacterium]